MHIKRLFVFILYLYLEEKERKKKITPHRKKQKINIKMIVRFTTPAWLGCSSSWTETGRHNACDTSIDSSSFDANVLPNNRH